MKRLFFVLSLGIGAMLLATTHAFAQQAQCAEHATIVDELATRYGENRQVIGLSSSNRVLEVFASTETGSWTITLTEPGGLTCLVAAGQGFEITPETTSETGNDA